MLKKAEELLGRKLVWGEVCKDAIPSLQRLGGRVRIAGVWDRPRLPAQSETYAATVSYVQQPEVCNKRTGGLFPHFGWKLGDGAEIDTKQLTIAQLDSTQVCDAARQERRNAARRERRQQEVEQLRASGVRLDSMGRRVAAPSGASASST